MTGLVDTTVDGVTIDDTAASALTGSLARAQAGTLAGEQAGGYAISQGTLAADSNYTITFTGSTLDHHPGVVDRHRQSPDQGLRHAPIPALTVDATGLVDATVDGVAIDDTAATVLTGHLARTSGETVAGGPYRDHPGDARGRQQLHDPASPAAR